MFYSLVPLEKKRRKKELEMREMRLFRYGHHFSSSNAINTEGGRRGQRLMRPLMGDIPGTIISSRHNYYYNSKASKIK
jgi:hypothetical protein